MVKGFLSQLKKHSERLGSILYESQGQIYATLSGLAGDKFGLDMFPKYLGIVSSGLLLDAVPQGESILTITGHTLRKWDWIRFTSGVFTNTEVQVIKVIDANTVMISNKIAGLAGGEVFTQLRSVSPTTDLTGNLFITGALTTVVDFLDAGALIPTGASAIPASTSPPLQVVASLVSSVTKIQVISDVGEFINLYSDAAGAVLLAHLNLTPDEVVDVDIPAGATLYIRNQKNAIIDDVNSVMSINFIG